MTACDTLNGLLADGSIGSCYPDALPAIKQAFGTIADTLCESGLCTQNAADGLPISQFVNLWADGLPDIDVCPILYVIQGCSIYFAVNDPACDLGEPGLGLDWRTFCDCDDTQACVRVVAGGTATSAFLAQFGGAMPGRCGYLTVIEGTRIWISIDGITWRLLRTETAQAIGTTTGGYATGVWLTRALSSLEWDDNVGAVLASNQITLPAGTYIIELRTMTYAQETGAGAGSFCTVRLWNSTAAAAIKTSPQSAYGTGANQSHTHVVGFRCRVTFAVSTTIRVESNAGGISASTLQTEVYIQKG